MYITYQIWPFETEEKLELATWVVRPSIKSSISVERKCYGCYGAGCRKCDKTGKLRGTLVLRLEPIGGFSDRVQYVQEIAKRFAKEGKTVISHIKVTEHGGAMTSGGSSHIVCGLKGEILKSAYLLKEACGHHAVFFVRRCLSVEYENDGGSGKVTFVRLSEDKPGEERILKDRIFEFNSKLQVTYKNPNFNFVFPERAATAARRKSFHYHCRMAYFAG